MANTFWLELMIKKLSMEINVINIKANLLHITLISAVLQLVILLNFIYGVYIRYHPIWTNLPELYVSDMLYKIGSKTFTFVL